MRKVNTRYVLENRQVIREYKNENSGIEIKLSAPLPGTKRVGKVLSLRSGSNKIKLTGSRVTALRRLLSTIAS